MAEPKFKPWPLRAEPQLRSASPAPPSPTNKPSAAKATTYESGIEPFHDANIRFHARYYIFALLFVIFDVETLFLYPWAVAYDKLGLFALIEMLIFVVMLLVGLAYAWKKKVLQWL